MIIQVSYVHSSRTTDESFHYFVLPSENQNAFAHSADFEFQLVLYSRIETARHLLWSDFFCKDLHETLKYVDEFPEEKNKLTKSHTSLSLSLSLSTCRSANAIFTLTCLHQSLSLSLYISKHGLDQDQTQMVFRIAKCYYCGMSDFAIQKLMRTISLGFGSPSEAVVTTQIVFWYSKKPSQRLVCKHCAVSLSLSLSLLLRSAIKVCKQFGSRRSSDMPDQGQTSIPALTCYNLVWLCVLWSRNISDKYLLSDACHGRIQRWDRGSGPPWKITKI